MTIDHSTPITKFYAGQSVLITGGTGFLGKLLIEKLLRTCQDLKSIYLLTRPGKHGNVQQRTDKMFEEVVFDRLKSEVPNYREKIFVVHGDYSMPGLGMSRSDVEVISKNVSIVFNVAATVRFNEKLKDAVFVNVQGTKEIMELCRSMSNLRVVVHVSTAYSNCSYKKIEERFYDPPMSPEEIMRLARTSTDEELDFTWKKLSKTFPNTYVCTKCIAEELVRRYGEILPVGVFRPAIVISTYKEPIEGWVDNLNGPTGALAAGGIGLLRTSNMDTNCRAELVPADYVINALVATAWSVATSRDNSKDPPIYNYLSTWDEGINWGRYMNLALKHGSQAPSVRAIWCHNFTPIKGVYLYNFSSIFLHFLPGLLSDFGSILLCRKPTALKAYKKLYSYLSMTEYFCTRDWTFTYDNTEKLWESMCPLDRSLFPFSMRDFDWDDFMYKTVLGIRLHIFKDDPSTIPQARKRMNRFNVAQRLLKYLACVFATWLLYCATRAILM